jgi:hypothetical protein
MQLLKAIMEKVPMAMTFRKALALVKLIKIKIPADRI